MSRRSARTWAQKDSYKELSSTDSSDASSFDTPPSKRRRPPPAKTRSAETLGTKTKSRTISRKPNPVRRSGSTDKSLYSTSTLGTKRSKPSHLAETDGNIPPWNALPYEILLSLFRFASYPLQDADFRQNSSASWLVQTARVCKAFAEPALAALYECPPIMSPEQSHQLQHTLELQPETTFIDYRSKVQRLYLDTRRTLVYTAPRLGPFRIQSIFRNTPNLIHLDISDAKDRPPYRFISSRGRWSYPINLVTTLEEASIRLQRWRWSAELSHQGLFPSVSIHRSAVFHSLRHLTLSNFIIRDVGEQETPWFIMSASKLHCLSSLESLTLESCGSDDDSWAVPLKLGRQLRTLKMIDLDKFNDTHLGKLLHSSGGQLRNLVLSHNPSVSLSFVASLSNLCPLLEALEMDLTYFSPYTVSVIDTQPNFEVVFPHDQTPRWPKSLQRLELLHLRPWGIAAATAFLGSLEESAAELRFLQSIVIKAIIDVSWKDRAKFREEWSRRLKNAFLRQSPSPNAHLHSSKAYRKWMESLETRITRSAAKDDREPGTEGAQHGQCSVVSISIDNHRPTENTLGEGDFLDSERSGDEEWSIS